jgi:hypothetical protein
VLADAAAAAAATAAATHLSRPSPGPGTADPGHPAQGCCSIVKNIVAFVLALLHCSTLPHCKYAIRRVAEFARVENIECTIAIIKEIPENVSNNCNYKRISRTIKKYSTI